MKETTRTYWYRKGRKATFRVLYPCHHRDDTDITVQYY